MSSASDISNLFQMLGVSPSNYQELERAEQGQGSRGRWSVRTEAPVETTQEAVAGEAETEEAETTEEVKATPAEPQPPVASPIAAAAPAPESSPEWRAAPEAPALPSSPEPVATSQQPAALSSVFARLLERNDPPADASHRQTS